MDSAIQDIGSMATMQATTAAANAYTAPKLGKLGAGGNVDKASKDFESMFMSQMLQPMFDGMEVNPLFGGGQGEKIMRSFLVQEYGKLASQSSHLGIASAVKSEMIRAQGAQTPTTTNGGQNGVVQ